MFVLPEQIFPLRPPVPLPKDIAENELFDWLKNFHVVDAPDEIINYCIQDFRRFVYTYGLVEQVSTGGCIRV